MDPVKYKDGLLLGLISGLQVPTQVLRLSDLITPFIHQRSPGRPVTYSVPSAPESEVNQEKLFFFRSCLKQLDSLPYYATDVRLCPHPILRIGELLRKDLHTNN